MAKVLRSWDVDQGWLLPPSLHEFVPPGHMAHFVRTTVREVLDLSAIHDTYSEERGYLPYHPGMMVALLLYCYSRGLYSSRHLARACEERVDVMAVTGLDWCREASTLDDQNSMLGSQGCRLHENVREGVVANEPIRVPKDEISLALSGGGFRATLFHLGTLRRLNELGLLARLGRISCVSGGSIIGGVLAKAWDALAAARWSAKTFDELVAEPIRDFCGRNVDAWAIGEGALLPGTTAANVVTRAYRERLFGDFALKDLPTGVEFVFNATNLQTGRLVRFQRDHIRDYSVGSIDQPQLDLATVAAASSAFPPFLSPLTIDAPGPFTPMDGAIHAGDPKYTQRLHLTDGGVYDNLGLEPIWKASRTVLVSDAGAPFQLVGAVETDWVRQTLRALDVATDQSRGLRKRWLVDRFERKDLAGCYWGIDTGIDDYPVEAALSCDPAIVGPLASIRTRLNAFDEVEQGRLANWGYVLCDTAIAGHAPELLPEAQSKPSWPFPHQALGA